MSQSHSRASPIRDSAEITKKVPTIKSTRHAKSSKGKGRSSPPGAKDPSWAGDHPWRGIASDRDDVAHAAASGSSRSFSKGYKFDDRDIDAPKAKQVDDLKVGQIQDLPGGHCSVCCLLKP